MRTVTYNAGAYLIEDLKRAGIVARFLHDGGDIILFQTVGGQRVSIHLIESPIEVYEIRHILDGNDAEGIHTLFILWGDRLLPSDGHVTQVPDWMEAFYTLYGDKIYAYDIYGWEIFVFPVYFDGYGTTRTARYGTTVHIPHLHCATTRARSTNFVGAWRVASFGTQRQHAHDHRDDTDAPPVSPLDAYYDLLGVDADDDREAIKKAYRLLARRYHPDLNKAPDATLKMQQINAAYDALMTALDDE